MDRAWGGSVNLEPFHTIRNYIRYYKNTGSYVSVINLLGNVLIMVPLGGGCGTSGPSCPWPP